MDPEAGGPGGRPLGDTKWQSLHLTHGGQTFPKPVMQLLLQASCCWDFALFQHVLFSLQRESTNVKPKHFLVTRQRPFPAGWDYWAGGGGSQGYLLGANFSFQMTNNRRGEEEDVCVCGGGWGTAQLKSTVSQQGRSQLNSARRTSPHDTARRPQDFKMAA